MKKSEFEKLVVKSLKDLPDNIREMIDNVAVCVEDDPSDTQKKETGTRRGLVILGLYEGVPKTEWGRGFGGNIPDKITIFRNSILRFCRSEEDVYRMVRGTVYHEIAHHFGFSEKEVRKWEGSRAVRPEPK